MIQSTSARIFSAVFTLLALGGLSAPAAHASSINTLCRSNHLKQLQITAENGSEDSKFPKPDYCQVPDSQIPTQILQVAEQVGRLNAQAISFLNTSWEQVHREDGISLLLLRSVRGPLGSETDGEKITIGIFPDWPANGTQDLPPGIYVHELGHVLANVANESRIGADPELARSPLMVESIADLLALGVTGTVMGQTKALPGCLSQGRQYTPSQSFSVPEDDFLVTASFLKIRACCESLSKSGVRGHDQNGLCKDVNEMISEAKKNSQWPELPETKNFDAADYAKEPGLFDPHEIGIPVDSFLLDLKRNGVQNAFQLFLDAYSEATRNQSESSSFRCVLPKVLKPFEEAFPGKTIQVPTLGDVLTKLKEKVDSSEFDRLFSDHALSEAIAMSRADGARTAEELSKPFLRAALSKLPASRQEKNPCWVSALHEIDPDVTGCSATCSFN